MKAGENLRGGASSDTQQETVAKQTRKRRREPTVKIEEKKKTGPKGKVGEGPAGWVRPLYLHDENDRLVRCSPPSSVAVAGVTVAACSTPRVPSSHSFAACRWTRETAAHKAAGCYGCACDHSTNRTIVSEAAGRRDTHAILKARRNSQSQTGSVTKFSYCNKEHQYPCTRVLYTGADLTDL